MTSGVMAPPDTLDFTELSERLESAVPALMSLAARCAIPAELRATAWRLFLRVVPSEAPERWAKRVGEQRAAYGSMRERTMARLAEAMSQALPETDEEAGGDLVELEDAADQIRRDLERCYPEGAGDFFVEASRQKLMFDVLLVWAHQHPAPSYRQGMHELLAPLVWAMTESFEATTLVCLPPNNPLNALRVDLAFLEADVYWLFAALADIAVPLYESSVVASCHRIQGDQLARADPELAAHLRSFERTKDPVLPQIYMLSWLRLAFARQFTLRDVLKLWDAFFATCRLEATSEPEANDFVLVKPYDATRHLALNDWLEATATLLLVLERDKLLCAASGSACLAVLLRTVAPEPLYVTYHARRLHADPVASPCHVLSQVTSQDPQASLQPIIASLRQHVHLAHIFPAWIISLLGSLGVVAPAPKLSMPNTHDAALGTDNQPTFFGRLLALVRPSFS